MKTFFNFILLALSLSFLVSCSGYVNSLHNQLDKDMGIGQKRKKRYDQFAQYRNRRNGGPNKYRNGISSKDQRRLDPSVRRKYQPKAAVKRRYSADDLTDNTNTASLWAGKGKTKHLFTLNKDKNNGDIILINVYSKLKNEMTSELKRAFPDRKKAPIKKIEGAAPATAAAAPAVQAPEEEGDGDPKKVHDRISSVVVEEVNQDHLLLRGRKSLLFKGRKRMMEIQALVSRRDVTDDDTVHSDKVLESNISVIR